MIEEITFALERMLHLDPALQFTRWKITAFDSRQFRARVEAEGWTLKRLGWHVLPDHTLLPGQYLLIGQRQDGSEAIVIADFYD